MDDDPDPDARVRSSSLKRRARSSSRDPPRSAARASAKSLQNISNITLFQKNNVNPLQKGGDDPDHCCKHQDIDDKICKHQHRLATRRNFTINCEKCNDYLYSALMELDDHEQKDIAEQIELTKIDTSEQMNIAKKTSNMIRAEVEKLVACRDDIIKEIHDDKPAEFDIFKNISLNLKLRLYEKPGPLTLTFTYRSSAMAKSVMLYVSHTTKEPTQHSNMASHILSRSPMKIKVAGQIDPKTQKQIFEKQWLYMTLVYDQEEDCSLKIAAKFNYQVKKTKDKKKIKSPLPVEHPAEPEEGKAPELEGEIVHTFSDQGEGEIELDDFNMGSGPI